MSRFIEITDDRTGYSHKPVLVNMDYVFKIEPWKSSDDSRIGTVVYLAVNDCHNEPYQRIITYRSYEELAGILSDRSASPATPDSSGLHNV